MILEQLSTMQMNRPNHDHLTAIFTQCHHYIFVGRCLAGEFRKLFKIKMSTTGAVSKLSLPGPLKAIGKKHVEIASQWIGSAIAFGTTAGLATCYATDWKLILQYLPYYNGKFREEE